MTTTTTRPETVEADPRAPVHYGEVVPPSRVGTLCGVIGILTVHPDRVTCGDCNRLLELAGVS